MKLFKSIVIRRGKYFVTSTMVQARAGMRTARRLYCTAFRQQRSMECEVNQSNTQSVVSGNAVILDQETLRYSLRRFFLHL
mmetsp:Transcript_24118/g.66866  ORF Transcript_24118/g.66866 Transcript_24118/m.66866 type:complete len:81 (-) Transcript_24118:1381-1623(-)